MATENERSRGAKEEVNKQNLAYRATTAKAKSDLHNAQELLATQATQIDLLMNEVTNNVAYLYKLRTEYEPPSSK